MTHFGHHTEVCRCGKVLRTCRCMDADKPRIVTRTSCPFCVGSTPAETPESLRTEVERLRAQVDERIRNTERIRDLEEIVGALLWVESNSAWVLSSESAQLHLSDDARAVLTTLTTGKP